MSNNKDRAIVVKRVAPKKGGHHGGAWKLAYADFMTAMMAFFLLMWLLSSASTVQLKGIADYFNQPLKVTLWGGDRSAEDSSIVKGGGRDISSQDDGVTRRSDGMTARTDRSTVKHNDDEASKTQQGSLERQEQVRLHDLQVKLMAAIEANPVLRQFKQQIRIDSTLQGLRIEIVDSQKRPMFATARDVVEPYMRDILQAIGKTLNDVPNRIVVQGHTDAVPYAGGEKGYSNWELSADRANASRRELIAGGMDEAKVLRVLGLASTQNLNKADPLDPENRRISIIVLNKKSEEALMHDDSTTTTLSDDAAGSGKALSAGALMSGGPAGGAAGSANSSAPAMQKLPPLLSAAPAARPAAAVAPPAPNVAPAVAPELAPALPARSEAP
ncbi:flagellar motor protein MotB [Paraburkholderia tropica]|uniref:Chemotaxis protein MotB n=1 Tax=Paraburkholderia tropica TaxID=92647 RepID=A0AAQ1GE60_9BURK|nr:flagellar motor protein MotB [Paraburkholderia tropica]MBB2977896.1 chemotaxis protein MotB [Paraburkholderia tropica]MBB2998418.1 chemotaxis protein MotB [Paraburkholderia tropica]MBB6317460.1 chemotaxis protein MotB [Paraburkholderia tropica]MDE1142572.1 flagellar motor protein MotB [Paraburkholderia tropica]PXX15337.1 chemotaxis protein MotB [Paraburkholderia tropica]